MQMIQYTNEIVDKQTFVNSSNDQFEYIIWIVSWNKNQTNF